LIEDRVAVAEILPARFHRSPGAPEPVALSPTRDRLRQAITRLASLQREAEAAAEPVRRFHDVVAEHARQSAHLVDCYRQDREALAQLIAEGDPRRSVTSHETVRANAVVTELTEAKAAAELALPAAEATQRSAIERVNAAQSECNQALYGVAIEIAADLRTQVTGFLNEALIVEARMRSIADALRDRGNRGDNAALAAANVIIEAITAARRAAAVEHVPEYGRQLLDQLSRDPAAGLLS
jgi:hypothetical protein